VRITVDISLCRSLSRFEIRSGILRYRQLSVLIVRVDEILRRILIAALLSVVVVPGRAQSIPAQLKSARTVAIVNNTGDPTALEVDDVQRVA